MNLLRFSFVLLCCTLISCGKPEFTDNQGNGGKFSDFHGRWLIINYWATWCKPCIEEIPELNQLSSQHSEKLIVLGVDFDQNQNEKLQQAIDKLNIRFRVLSSDPASILGFEKPSVLPTTVIFTPQGEFHRLLIGPQTQHSLLNQLEL